MRDEEKHIDHDLLGKHFAGEASLQEERFVQEWLNASEQNRQEYIRLRRLWLEAESLINTQPAEVDTDEAWNKLAGRIFEEAHDDTIPEQDQNDTIPERDLSNLRRARDHSDTSQEKDASDFPTHTKIRGLWYYASRIAAVILIGVLIYALMVNREDQTDLVEVVAEHAIEVAELPDETRITLNEASMITYPEKFDGNERKVMLTGEAFFEVAADEEVPFIIEAQDARIQVLGTSFNVRAMHSESVVSVTVESGKVKLSDEDDVAFVILEANEKGIFNRQTGHIEKYDQSEGSEMFWRSKTLIFRDTELSSVFRTLEKLYQVRIIVNNEQIHSCLLTGKFREMEIEEILEKIAINFDLSIQKNNNTFEISGEGC